MADLNTFQTPTHVAEIASKLVAADAPLAALVHTDHSAEFGPGTGDVIKVRVPGVATAATRPVGSHADYEVAALHETTIDVKLTDEAYSVVPLTLGEQDLGIADYARQVLDPQCRTVAAHVERAIAATLATVPASESIAYNAADPRAAVIRARAAIRANGADSYLPLQVVAGANVYADMLAADQIVDGKIAELEVHESTAVPSDALYVFARAAIALAIRAPKPHPKAVDGAAAQAADGVPVTVMQAFNGANAVTSSIVSCFVGVQPMPLLVPDYEAGTMTTLEHGACISVATAPAAG